MQWFPLLKYLFWGILCSFIILFVYRFVPNRNIMTLNDITWEFLGGKENLSIIRYHSKNNYWSCEYSTLGTISNIWREIAYSPEKR